MGVAGVPFRSSCRLQNGTPLESNNRWDLHQRIKAKIFSRPQFLPESYPTLTSYQEQLRRRDGWFDWLVQQEFEMFMTVTYLGKDLGERQLDSLMRVQDAKMDDYWLGRRWASQPPQERAKIWGLVEQGPKGGHRHVHALFNRPRRVREAGGWRDQPHVVGQIFSAAMQQATGLPIDIRLQRIREDEQPLVVAYLLKRCLGSTHPILFGGGA